MRSESTWESLYLPLDCLVMPWLSLPSSLFIQTMIHCNIQNSTHTTHHLKKNHHRCQCILRRHLGCNWLFSSPPHSPVIWEVEAVSDSAFSQVNEISLFGAWTGLCHALFRTISKALSILKLRLYHTEENSRYAVRIWRYTKGIIFYLNWGHFIPIVTQNDPINTGKTADKA